MRRAALALAALLAASACVWEPEPARDPSHDPDEWPPPPPDPEPVPPPEPPCQSTCDEWRRLECEEGDETDEGAACEVVCQNAAEHGFTLSRELGCMRAAQTCEAARDCPRAD